MASGQKRDRVSVNLNTVPLRGAKGEWLGTMLVFEDITREKRIKSTMARYMAKEVAEKLLESGDDALGGVCQTATVVFSDIRGFTGLSEALGPQETVSMLNEYFTVMVDSVFREGGILDKFIGDAMMALFGVPFRKDDDADRAMRAAISMLQDLRRLNFDRRAEGKKPIKIGIGVNTGEVVSGNIGSVRRMDYTAIGDGVNLASRLEGSCKTYGTQLIVSEFTVAALQGDYCLRDVDCVLVMGKTEPVHLYEALDYTDEETFPCRERVVRIYQEGIAHYRDRDWTQAMRRFYEALRIHPADYLSRLYAERCEYFLKTPPDDDWNGAWTMVTK